MVKIAWVSKHSPLPVQVKTLRNYFGKPLHIVRVNSFGNAYDILRRVQEIGAEAMVVVVPLSVLKILSETAQIPILWAEMVQVSDEEADLIYRGRPYRFTRFRIVKRVNIEFEDHSKLRRCEDV